MNIRPMMESDIPALARLMAATPLWQRYNVSEASAAQRLLDGWRDGATIAIAEWEGQPTGFVWHVERGAFNRSGYILLIGVQPEVKGRGIGQALMEHAEQALAIRARDVFLLVSDFNTAAQNFYARLGYVQVGAISDYVVPGVTELIFHKRLVRNF